MEERGYNLFLTMSSTTDGSAMDASESAVESFVATLEGEAHGVANAALNSMKSAHATIKALIASL